jgi:hypothetical protein
MSGSVQHVAKLVLVFAVVACANHERTGMAPSPATSPATRTSVASVLPLSSGRDLEPEGGPFGQEEPTAYELRLRHALLGDYLERKCQLLAEPSVGPEYAAYIASDEHGAHWVVHRRFYVNQSSLLQGQMERPAGGGEGTGVARTRHATGAALAKVNGTTELFKAEIDADAVLRLSSACQVALARTRVQAFLGTTDGVRYHASHVSREFPVLTAQTHSPSNGTVAGDYVLLGENLAAYAASAPQVRPAIRLKLLGIADALLRGAAGPRQQ